MSNTFVHLMFFPAAAEELQMLFIFLKVVMLKGREMNHLFVNIQKIDLCLNLIVILP